MTNSEQDNNILAWAKRYNEHGVSVIPIALDGSKRPSLSQWKIWQSQPQTIDDVLYLFSSYRCGIAAICGSVSGNLECLDFDDGNLYEPFVQMAADAVKDLPVVLTPSGGYHIVYRCDTIEGSQKLARDDKNATLIETRGQGAIIVTVGSPVAVHKAGRLYKQISGPPYPESIPTVSSSTRKQLFEIAKSFDRPLINPVAERKVKLRAKFLVAARGRLGRNPDAERLTWAQILEPFGWVNVGGAGWRRPGKSEGASAFERLSTSGDHVLVVFSTDAGPLSAERGHRTWSKSAAFRALGLNLQVEVPHDRPTFKDSIGDVNRAAELELDNEIISDDLRTAAGRNANADAMRLASVADGEFAYVKEWGTWLHYRKGVWKRDPVAIQQCARRLVATYFAVIPEMAQADAQLMTALVQHAKSANSKRGIDEMIRLAQSDVRLVVLASELDSHPHLLNALNKVVDLTTGEALPHSSALYLTQQTAVEYNEAAKCPKWEAFLDLVFDGDCELIRYVRQLLGLCCSGLTDEHVFIIAYGHGCNGKSTLLEVVQGVLGDYAHPILPDVIPSALCSDMKQRLLNYSEGD